MKNTQLAFSLLCFPKLDRTKFLVLLITVLGILWTIGCKSIPEVIQTESGTMARERLLSLPDNSRLWDPMTRAQQLKKLPESERSLMCLVSIKMYQKPSYYSSVKIPNPKASIRAYIPNTMAYIYQLFKNLTLYLGTADSAVLVRLAADLEEAADADAFVKAEPWAPTPNYSPYNEPVYCQRTVLLALAFAAQAVFDSPDVSQETKDRIRAWGDKLLAATESGRDQISAGKADDRTAQRAATLASWGAVTGNKEVFALAMQKYWQVVSRISSHGGHRRFVGPGAQSGIPRHLQLRYNNMIIGWLSMTAEAAEVNGIPLYGVHAGETTLHDAIRWHVMATVDPDFQDRTPPHQNTPYRWKKNSTGSENFAWLESYAARFPDRPIVEEISKITEIPIVGGYFGGYTACKYRRLE